MRLLPAIDLKDGQCVRLQKGDFETTHRVADSALETAREFVRCGAQWVHMVDLDAAKTGSRANEAIVREIVENTPLKVELGGGIRSMEDLEYVFRLGVSRAVIGSAAVQNPELVAQAVERYGPAIAVGIDALFGTVRTQGWLDDSKIDYIELAKRMENAGVKTIIFTDINKDGMLEGPNFQQLAALRQAVKCGIVASGGVSSLEDIDRLREMGIEEAIAGKAVYTGALDLRQALQKAGEPC